MSALTDLLDCIDPTQTLDPVEQEVGGVLEQSEFRALVIDDYDEIRQRLARFVQLARNAVCHVPPESGEHLEINLGEALTRLQNQGYPHFQAIHQQSSTGTNGGLRAVLQKLAAAMMQEYAGRKISCEIGEYWEGLSTKQKLAAPDEYIVLYRDVLPKDVTEGSGVRFRGFFWQVLERHPYMLRDLRRQVEAV
jgi:hypothetical protein